jgi:hypothetical protein
MLIGEKCKDIVIVIDWASNHKILEEMANSSLKKYLDHECIGLEITSGSYVKKEDGRQGTFFLSTITVKKEE